jgi:hypothetical protein
MPRDLLADRKTLDAMPQLSREPATSPPPQVSSPKATSNQGALIVRKLEHIHPFAQLLNYEDLDDCDWLEHAAFDPIEAATREKVNTNQFHVTTLLPVRFNLIKSITIAVAQLGCCQALRHALISMLCH